MRQRTGDSAAVSGGRDAAFSAPPSARSGPDGNSRTRSRAGGSPGLSGISDST